MGYQIALWRDDAPTFPLKNLCGMINHEAQPYPGYAKAVNYLTDFLIKYSPSAEWFIAAGDDTLPDPNHTAEEIAQQCGDYFEKQICEGLRQFGIRGDRLTFPGGLRTWGVMQPTGHRWGENEPWARQKFPDRPAYIDRVCGSAWMGREYCKRAHQGRGPLHPDFYHMHVDEALYEYAKMLGVLWQRRDLTHFHNHWGLTGDPRNMPEFLRKVNTPEHWKESLAILDRLKAEKFASCLPL